MDVLGLAVNDANVHRPELFSAVSGAEIGSKINADHIARLYDHPNGGMKNNPADVLRIAYMTHADTPERIKAGQYIGSCLNNYDIICLSR